jgi:hypothetical protein
LFAFLHRRFQLRIRALGAALAALAALIALLRRRGLLSILLLGSHGRTGKPECEDESADGRSQLVHEISW